MSRQLLGIATQVGERRTTDCLATPSRCNLCATALYTQGGCMVGKTIKGISSLLLAVLFSLTGYAHDVDSNAGKSGYLTGTFFLFQMNSNKQLLQWDSDLGQVISRKSPSDLPFTLKFSRQQPEPEQLGAAIVPVPLAIRDFRFGRLRNNSSVSPGPAWYSFPTASMATFPLPQGTRHWRSPQKTYDFRQGVDVTLLVSDGMWHVPIANGSGVPELQLAYDELIKFLRRHLGI